MAETNHEMQIGWVKGFIILVGATSLIGESPAEERLNEAQRNEMIARRVQHITDAVTAGKMGERQAEFLLLLQQPFTSLDSRNMVIQEWREKKGAGYDQEYQTEQLRLQPERDARRSEITQRRRQIIEECRRSGDIGEKEASFQALLVSYAAPEVQRETLNAWLDQNGAGLESERAAQRRMRGPEEVEHRAGIVARREKIVDMALAEGKIGPLEGEYLKMLIQQGQESGGDREAIRLWYEANREGLATEIAQKRKGTRSGESSQDLERDILGE